MYNAAPPYAGGQQSPYGGAGQAGMAGGGMMHGNGNNGPGNGMPQMAPGMNGSSYQTPYSGSPYGNHPTSAALPPNFMSPTSSMSASYSMNNPNMIPQQQQQHPSQRMHPTATPTQNNSQRGPSYGAHSSPPNVSQPQFATPQNPNQAMLQTGNLNQQQTGSNMILTPQTPTFPSGAQGAAGGNISIPLSPGSEAIEKERVTLLLEINMELLMEVMRLQAMQAEAKKEEAAAASDGAVEKDKADKERAEKLKSASGRDYLECMRRLQCNLAYLAAIADRSHKPSSQIPSHPAIMSPPALTTPSLSSPKSTTSKKETTSPTTADKPLSLDDPHRGASLKEQYTRLQALFPGVDPRKDPPLQTANAQAARAKQQQMMQQQMGQNQGGGNQQSGGTVGGGGQQGAAALDPNHAQKVQNDLLRQKMMQQQYQVQQHQQQQAQQQAQMNAQFQMQGR